MQLKEGMKPILTFSDNWKPIEFDTAKVMAYLSIKDITPNIDSDTGFPKMEENVLPLHLCTADDFKANDFYMLQNL